MRIGRSWFLPAVAVILAAVLYTSTWLEQERQYDALRTVYESHAAMVGNLVRESAQEATWALDLVYVLTAEESGDLLRLLGPAPESACTDDRMTAGDIVTWLSVEGDRVRGCHGPVPPAQALDFANAVLADPDSVLVETEAARAYGVFCTSRQDDAVETVLCRDRGRLDRMRREVGLGPLLSAWKGRDLDYVVIQDGDGILASTPAPGALSAFAGDPILQAVLDGDGSTSRLLPLDTGAVFEVAGTVVLGDGSRAVVRTGLDASGLQALRDRIDHRRIVMGSVLSILVLLCAGLAAVLDRADRRRREHAAALERQEEAGRHWQALGQMAATVAHEVRNPLNTIGMAIQRLGAEFTVGEADRAEFEDLLRLSADASSRVERIVTEFLELGRPLELELKPVPARSLVLDSLEPLALRADREAKRLEFDCLCPQEVRVDRQRFGQALFNLVSNALDAVGSGGTVKIRAGCDGKAFVVHVRDDGPGMDAETVGRVQEPFVTTKAHGTGLGLPLAKRLVEAHGGTLAIASTPGQGTEVTITLPRERT